jgi:hypothetical protein
MGTPAGRTPRGPVQLYVCRGPSTCLKDAELYTTGSTEARLMTKYGINGNCRIRKSGSTSNGMFFSSIHWRAEP